jgi:hypothetical protein
VSKIEEEQEWCPNCRKVTKQERRYSTHERDASDDWFKCLECGAHYTGLTGLWYDKDRKEIPWFPDS